MRSAERKGSEAKPGNGRKIDPDKLKELLAEDTPIADCARLLGVSYRSVKMYILRHEIKVNWSKITFYKQYTKEQERTIKAMANNGVPYYIIANIFNRSVHSMRVKLYNLGVKSPYHKGSEARKRCGSPVKAEEMIEEMPNVHMWLKSKWKRSDADTIQHAIDLSATELQRWPKQAGWQGLWRTLAHRRMIDLRREDEGRNRVGVKVIEVEYQDTDIHVEAGDTQVEAKDAVYTAVAKLPKHLRELIKLELRHKSIAEIAAMLNVGESTAFRWREEAYKALRSLINVEE